MVWDQDPTELSRTGHTLNFYVKNILTESIKINIREIIKTG